ncbi:hypothetical protein BH20VER2_BH20VER2_12010 [soil metagenome]
MAAIHDKPIEKRRVNSFVSYSEALDRLGISYRGRAGQKLRKEGLDDLNEWTKAHSEIPKITGLIIDKRKKKPGAGFIKSYGRTGKNWMEWWLREADKAIDFDWSQFLNERSESKVPEMPEFLQRIRETDEATYPKQVHRVTFDPGVMGGRPCIRGMRVTVGIILGLLASGHSREKVLKLYPYLEAEDIDAALSYGAKRADEPRRAAPLESGRLSRLAERWAGKFKLPKPDHSDPRLTYLLDRYERNR